MKILSLIFLLVTPLCISACSSSSATTKLRTPKIAIELPPEPGIKLQPLRHPIPPSYGGFSSEQDSRLEITMRRFLMHPAHDGVVNTLALSRDGYTAYTGGHDGKVVRSTLRFPQALESEHSAGRYEGAVETETLLVGKKPILALSLSADERKLLVAQFSSVIVYDLDARRITNKLNQVKGRIMAVAWDPRGELVALGRVNGDVYVWNLENGPKAGQDNAEALERYEAGSSPIVSILFHPSGRAFFAAERGGSISLWRLLRTENELGIRDEQAIIDHRRLGRYRLRVPDKHGEIKDLWLDSEAAMLYAASVDGSLYSWKVRGLKPEGRIEVGEGNLFSVQGLDLALSPVYAGTYSRRVPLLVTSGRGQRLTFWCRELKDEAKVKEPTNVPVLKLGEPALGAPGGLNQVRESDDEASAGPLPGLVARSEVFKSPLTIVRAAQQVPVLWAAEKTGNLLTFNSKYLKSSAFWVNRMQHCKD